ncbi:acid phosphatase [Cordyceps fumosorosea ARSEF 2679]|uniref:Acid phosphatase n=1 Tax=Cordyceps fumosorosea (strain ARSEF 2679) TaxID=1081104 RepID=A0A167UEY0_CORFA|nr:acid phosphatase [Cordyceps fumosorosea ARSEF 2679]OAA61519.1 acid phosphatase [Cordyceps fumosorosea ARSEF 2679]
MPADTMLLAVGDSSSRDGWEVTQDKVVRKHNPAVLHESVTSDPARLARVKSLTRTDTGRSEFHRDLAADALPQWMFITPNMTSDGARHLRPGLRKGRNRVLGVLLGDAVPRELAGTSDDAFYTHYSQIATVVANWGKTGDRVRAWDGGEAELKRANKKKRVIPRPNLDLDRPASGRPILQGVKDAWAGSSAPTYYEDTIKIPDGRNPPKGFKPDDPGAPRPPPSEETIRTYLEMLQEGYQGLLESRDEGHQKARTGRALFLKTHILDIADPTLFHSDLRRSSTACPPEFTLHSSSPSPPSSSSGTPFSSSTPSGAPRPSRRPPTSAGGSGITAPHATGARLTRALYEWYLQAGHRPGPVIVLDADEVLEGDTARSSEGLDAKRRRFVGDLWGSTGIDASKSARRLDVEAKFASWREMYGAEADEAMTELATSHMEDYMWLKSRKF